MGVVHERKGAVVLEETEIIHGETERLCNIDNIHTCIHAYYHQLPFGVVFFKFLIYIFHEQTHLISVYFPLLSYICFVSNLMCMLFFQK